MVPDNADKKRFNNTFLEVLCYTISTQNVNLILYCV